MRQERRLIACEKFHKRMAFTYGDNGRGEAMDRAWKIRLAAKAFTVGALTISAMAILFYSAMSRFQTWPIESFQNW